MKVVAISQRVDTFLERGETLDSLDQRLINLITKSGYIPVPIPNTLRGETYKWLAAIQPAAVLLSGGNDIGQNFYRDETEYYLMDYAQANQIPLLGICRGMQIMANRAGASLHLVNGHLRARHQLVGSIVMNVNSYHNYALTACPEDYEVLALSEDGEIEAIRHKILQWEGWMWHPEREDSIAKEDVQRIKSLFG